MSGRPRRGDRLPAIGADGRRKRIAGLVLIGLGQAAAGGLAAFATRDVFAALHGRGDQPLPALVAILLAALAIAALRSREQVAAERLGQIYAGAVRERLFLHVSRLAPSTLSQRSTGGLALRFVGDLGALRGWVAQGVARLITAAVTLPATGLVLVALDWRLAVAAATVLLSGLAAMLAAGPPLERAHRRLRRRRARLASVLTERLSHGAVLRTTRRLHPERRRLRRATATIVDAAVARAWLAGRLRAVPDVVAGCGAAAMLGLTWHYGITPATAAGALAAFGLQVQHLRTLAGVWDRRQAWVIARGRLDEALNAPALPRGAQRRQPRREAPALVLEGLSAGPHQPVDAILHAGKTLALQGPPGIGKSRLLLTLAGLERPLAGRAVVLGRPTGAVSTGAVCLIGGKAPLLRGSLRLNATLGLSRRPADSEIIRCCREHGLDRLVARTGGLDGRVGEAGRDISAGERARLLLVRAALMRPRLLLVDADEPALDPDGWALLMRLVARTRAAALIATQDAVRADAMSGTIRLCETSPPATASRQPLTIVAP